MDGLRSATPPSAAVLGERKYPVVFAEPTLGQVCESFESALAGQKQGLVASFSLIRARARAPLARPL